MPVYNQATTVAKAIESVVAQQCSVPFELIIADDFSTDGTREILNEYLNRYPNIIRLIENPSNFGLITNYYNAVKTAKGDYLCDLGGDDIWVDTRKLQSQYEVLENNDDVALVHTDWAFYNFANNSMQSPWHSSRYPYPTSAEANQLTPMLIAHPSPTAIHMSTAMYRRRDFETLYEEYPVAFNNKEFVVEDLQLIVLLSTMGRVVFINRITLYYGVTGKNMTSQTDAVSTFDVYFGAMKLTHYLQDVLKIENSVLQPVYERFYHFLLMQAFHSESNERRVALQAEAQQWNFKPLLKSSIVYITMSNKYIWRPTRLFWNIFRKVKKKKK